MPFTDHDPTSDQNGAISRPPAGDASLPVAALAHILESSGDALVVLDADWRYVYINTAAEPLIGKTFHELRGRQITEVFPEIVETAFWEIYNRSVHEQAFLTIEDYYAPLDTWFDIRVLPHNGLLYLHFRDTTAIRRSAEALRQAEAELARWARDHAVLVENTTESLVRYDRDLRFAFVNPAFERYTGFSRAEVLGKTLREAGFPEESAAAWEPMLQQVFATGEPLRTEVVLVRPKDGVPRVFERILTPEFDVSGSGEVKSVLTFSRDITEKKEQERRERLLADLTERIGSLLDPEEVLYQAAQAVGTFTGVSRCLYSEIDEDAGTMIVHRDFVQGEGVESIRGEYPLLAFGAPLAESMRAGNITLSENIATDERLTPEHRAIFQKLNFQSFLSVPLHKEGRWVASLILHHASPRRWTHEEAELLAVVAERTWLTVENARLYRAMQEEIEERAATERELAQAYALERARVEREALLSQASTLLSASLDYHETLAAIARLIVPHFADWCAVDLTDETGLPQRVIVEHVDPARAAWGWELHRRYPPPPDAPRGTAAVLRTGQSEFIPHLTDEMIVGAARDDEHLRLLREVGFTSVMMVPLIAGGSVLGVLTFVATRESGHIFTPEDLRMAEEIGRRAALAIQNARLFQTTQEALRATEAAEAKQRRIAETLQRSMLLTPPQDAFAGLEIGTHYAAAWDEALIGGDFFEAVPLDDDRVGLIVGDSTGKGLNAARFVSESQFTLRMALRDVPDPALALARLNKALIDGQRLDRRPENALVAVVAVVIDTRTGETLVSAGGAEPPLILRADTGTTEEVFAPGVLLGAAADAQYDSVRVTLAPGDLIVLVTDGVTEARNPRARQFFGQQGLAATLQDTLLTATAEAPALDTPTSPLTLLDEIAGEVVTRARDFTGGRLADDACVLVARRRTADSFTPSPLTQKENGLHFSRAPLRTR